jgi:DNA polymerase IIIc chi subunit
MNALHAICAVVALIGLAFVAREGASAGLDARDRARQRRLNRHLWAIRLRDRCSVN